MTALQLGKPLPTITWDKLPDDFILPDEPVDNNLQLLWGSEGIAKTEAQLQKTEAQLEQEQILRQRLVEKLRELGIEIETL
jgi:hypothetical protein